jgi:hypothetical protein
VSAEALAIAGGRLTRSLCWSLLLAGVLGLIAVQRRIDLRPVASDETRDVLYVPSGTILRHLALGQEGLLANIYWTRAVQYFGRKRMSHATQFELLGPLLRITTDLDPHLLIAYRFGAIFLAEKPPDGAGQPQEALQLLRRGIVANPDYWRLWEDVGFIYYWDLRDYPHAARAFQVGSERPGAMIWMKTMAATVAAKGGEPRTSKLLWAEIYRNADNEQIRRSAQEHLAALDAREQIEQIDGLLAQYRAREGHEALSLSDLVAAGFIPVAPRDSSGVPYVIGPGGRAALGPQSAIDLKSLE